VESTILPHRHHGTARRAKNARNGRGASEAHDEMASAVLRCVCATLTNSPVSRPRQPVTTLSRKSCRCHVASAHFYNKGKGDRGFAARNSLARNTSNTVQTRSFQLRFLPLKLDSSEVGSLLLRGPSVARPRYPSYAHYFIEDFVAKTPSPSTQRLSFSSIFFLHRKKMEENGRKKYHTQLVSKLSGE
jgi:hypothetical protein